MSKKVAVVGGGAAGLMAAVFAAENGNKVTVFERNPRPARKVMITGKGRCNVTNNCDRDTFLENVVHGGRFLFSAFNAFSTEDTISFFENAGVPLKTERGNRVFPVSDKAVDIVDALYNAAKKSGCTFINNRVSDLILEENEIKGIKTFSGEEYFFDAVILATGGASYPVTGSTGDGYIMAENSGHTVTKIRPSLVPLNAHEGFCTELCGLSLKNVRLSLYSTDKKKPAFSDLGEMMFTHFGITGPLVLSASAYMEENKDYFAIIDLKPALDRETLDKRIVRDFSAESNKDFINSLDRLLPKRLISVIVRQTGINPRKKVNAITKEERAKLVDTLKELRVTRLNPRPIEEAIITSGGVSLKEVNSATMESKIVSGLFFAGELLDIDALTGGFNLQIAFSTGYLAGKSV